ncbi:MAG: hypothetical protein RXR30_03255 [Nitrososphaeria archaeon]|jgi:hypothetical protein
MEDLNSKIFENDFFQIYELLSNFVETVRTGVMDSRLIKSTYNLLSKYENTLTENDLVSAWRLCRAKLQGITTTEEEGVSNNAIELSNLLILIDFLRNFFYNLIF